MDTEGDQDLHLDNVKPNPDRKFTHNDWNCRGNRCTKRSGIHFFEGIGQLTETLNVWAAYSLMFHNVFVSTDSMHICWAT